MKLGGRFSGPWQPPSFELRLRLGVKLASSVMQLHGSQWLNETWVRDDIFFIQGRTGSLIEKPFVNRSFFPDPAIAQQTGGCRHQHCAIELFLLGNHPN